MIELFVYCNWQSYRLIVTVSLPFPVHSFLMRLIIVCFDTVKVIVMEWVSIHARESSATAYCILGHEACMSTCLSYLYFSACVHNCTWLHMFMTCTLQAIFFSFSNLCLIPYFTSSPPSPSLSLPLSHAFPEVSKTLCPILNRPLHDNSTHHIIYIDISTPSLVNISFNFSAHIVTDYQLRWVGVAH